MKRPVIVTMAAHLVSEVLPRPGHDVLVFVKDQHSYKTVVYVSTGILDGSRWMLSADGRYSYLDERSEVIAWCEIPNLAGQFGFAELNEEAL